MNKPESKKTIRNKVLKQLREKRAAFEKEHPEMVKALRLLMSEAQDVPKKAEPKIEEPQNTISSGDEIRIDRQKNLEAIMKYAALKPGSEKLRAQLERILELS